MQKYNQTKESLFNYIPLLIDRDIQTNVAEVDLRKLEMKYCDEIEEMKKKMAK